MDPSLDHIDHGLESWDTIFNDDMDKVDANFLRSTKNADHGEKSRLKWYEATSGALAGASYTFAGVIPAGSILFGVIARVKTIITGATTWKLGDGVTDNQFATAKALAAGTTSGLADHQAAAVPLLHVAAGDVVVTANGPNFASGELRVAVLVLELDGMTSA